MKRLRTFLLALLLTCSVPLSVSAAEGNVTYSGNSGEFIFEPGSEYSPTDLFPNFKSVMPGDSISQTITVKNHSTNGVKVYIRALGAHENSEDFLSQLNLTVKVENGGELFEASADETAQLTDWVCLGMLFHGGEVDLRVTLDIPVTLGNEYSSAIGYLDWEFMIEEYNDDGAAPDRQQPETSDTPKTDDETNISAWSICLAAAVTAAIAILMIRRERRNDTKLSMITKWRNERK